VLGLQLPWMADIGRPRVPRRLPLMLSPDELAAVFGMVDSEHRVFAQLLYGTGMRLTEGLQLRVKDTASLGQRHPHGAGVARHADVATTMI
jgi:site-specific recombinase XerD